MLISNYNSKTNTNNFWQLTRASVDGLAQAIEPVLLGFRGVYVFDIAQTGGEQLPESRKPVDMKETLEKLIHFATAQGMAIEYADWLGSKKASSYRGVIRLLPGMKDRTRSRRDCGPFHTRRQAGCSP